MKIIIIGGGDIASNGIIPTVGGKCIPANECDIRNYDQVLNVISKEKCDDVTFGILSGPTTPNSAKPDLTRSVKSSF